MLQRIYGTAWPDEKSAQGLPDAAGGGREARPPQDRQGTGPVPLPGRGAGRGVLASEGLDAVPDADRLHARVPERGRLAGSQRARNHGRRSCGSSPGTWRSSARTCSSRETPDERKFYAIKPMNCPGHIQIFNQGLRSYRDLPLRFARVRQGASLRAVGRAARPDARARLHAGRRARLHHRGPDRRGERCAASSC